jgi:hypothetical protein
MKKLITRSAYLLSLIAIVACNNRKNIKNVSTSIKNNKTQVEVKPAPEWADMLYRNNGWMGADGIYCVPLNGIEAPAMADSAETLFWFSDTVIGDIIAGEDSLQNNWQLLHNSVAYFKGSIPDTSKIKFYYNVDSSGKAQSVFQPHTPQASPGDYYWLGDGFFNHAMDSTIYLFAYRVKSVPGGIYPFEDVGVSLIALPKGDKFPFTKQRQMDTPLFLKDSKGRGKVVFGICVLANTVGARTPKPDGYIYIYGIRGQNKELIVARVPDKDFENFSKWRYWDGSNWNVDIHSAIALTNRISNEMSVSFMEDGRVIATYQLDTNSPTVAVQVGKTPYGPFQPPRKIWETPELSEDIDFYTYNAKAHPHLSKPGELLISYNVNSFDFAADIIQHPHHLRPRFIKLKY